MRNDKTLEKINAYMAIHQRLGSKGNGDFNAIAAEVGYEEKLAYPLRKAKGPAGETIEFYQIPENEKERVLQELYPFAPIPSMEDTVFDIHEEKTFKVKDFLVMRDHDLNFLVSPFFCRSGGSVLDWISRDEGNNDDENPVLDLKTIAK